MTFDLMACPQETIRGFRYARDYAIRDQNPQVADQAPEGANPLADFFWKREAGNGVWKWLHYFEIYHRHLKKYVGQPVTVLEVGVFKGGGLDMWRDYFGPEATIHGMDVEERCRQFATDETRIFIGDQSDPAVWSHIKQELPKVDILIDDGGHKAHQQIPTIEEMLPHISKGGLYLCEDVHGKFNDFLAYVHGLSLQLHGCQQGTWVNEPTGSHAKRISFQMDIASIHIYPFVVVIEKAREYEDELRSVQRGDNFGS